MSDAVMLMAVNNLLTDRLNGSFLVAICVKGVSVDYNFRRALTYFF